MYFCKSCKAMRFFKLARYVYGWDVLVTTLSDVKGKLAIPLVSRREQTLKNRYMWTPDFSRT